MVRVNKDKKRSDFKKKNKELVDQAVERLTDIFMTQIKWGGKKKRKK